MKIRLYTLPNMVTLLNLLSGCAAVVYLLAYGNLGAAFIFICLGALFDFCDGLVARLTGSYSETGKELDSLADMVSFGVAPSAVLFTILMNLGVEAHYSFIVFIVACFSALRLAKFNVDEDQKETFIGLPTPAMAIFVSSVGYLIGEGRLSVEPYMVYTAASILSLLMVCNVEMFALKFSNYRFKGNQVRYSFIVVSVLLFAMFGVVALPFIIAAYIALSLIFWILKRA